LGSWMRIKSAMTGTDADQARNGVERGSSPHSMLLRD
jgi:hypothetical protein